MHYLISTLSILIWLLSNNALAGSLTNGGWTPNCGEKPIPPQVADRDADSYNRSVEAINNWQAQANKYYECIVNEANQDNKLIADKARQEQTEYKQSYESISNALDAAKKKVQRQ